MTERRAGIVLAALAVCRPYAYAWLQADLTLTSCSKNWETMVGKFFLVGQSITAVLPELIGAEEALQAVLNGKSAVYALQQVNRTQADGSIRYFSWQVTAVSPDELLVIAEDTTENGRLLQALEQVQNELSLLRQQAAKAKAT